MNSKWQKYDISLRSMFVLIISVIVLFSFSLSVFSGDLIPNLYHKYQIDINFSTKKIENNWEFLIVGAAGVGVSLFADKSIKTHFDNHRNKSMDRFTNFAKPFGNGFFVFPAVAGIGTAGYLLRDKKLANASYTALESGLTAAVITGIIKVTAGRARPDVSDDHLKFKPFSLSSNYQSFPSGDAATAWSTITPYAVYYHQPLLYLIPISVDIERIYKNKHWTSDTLMSSLIGFSVGYLFSKSHIDSRFSVFTDGKMVGISYKFY